MELFEPVEVAVVYGVCFVVVCCCSVEEVFDDLVADSAVAWRDECFCECDVVERDCFAEVEVEF